MYLKEKYIKSVTLQFEDILTQLVEKPLGQSKNTFWMKQWSKNDVSVQKMQRLDKRTVDYSRFQRMIHT